MLKGNFAQILFHRCPALHSFVKLAMNVQVWVSGIKNSIFQSFGLNYTPLHNKLVPSTLALPLEKLNMPLS
jgi:hypothetical protein